MINKFFIKKNATIKLALTLLNITAHKCLLVVDKNKKLLGTISDGDIRKHILTNNNLDNKIKDIYNKNPIKIYVSDTNNEKIKKIFVKYTLDILPVVSNNNIVKDVFTWDQILDLSNNPVDQLDINVVIMAGGMGKRLIPYTNKFPKALIQLNGETMISRIINKFIYYGINNISISVNYKKEIIIKQLNKEYKNNKLINLSYIIESKPLGTIGALSLLNKKKLSENILITNCDTFLTIDYAEIINFHKKCNYDITVVTSNKIIEIPYGQVTTKNNNQIIAIKEKPSIPITLNAGLYIINKDLLNLIPKNKKFDATDFINKALNKKFKIGSYLVPLDNWIEIGKVEDLENFKQILDF